MSGLPTGCGFILHLRSVVLVLCIVSPCCGLSACSFDMFKYGLGSRLLAVTPRLCIKWQDDNFHVCSLILVTYTFELSHVASIFNSFSGFRVTF